MVMANQVRGEPDTEMVAEIEMKVMALGDVSFLYISQDRVGIQRILYQCLSLLYLVFLLALLGF